MIDAWLVITYNACDRTAVEALGATGTSQCF
jgi:hypothetical protein